MTSDLWGLCLLLRSQHVGETDLASLAARVVDESIYVDDQLTLQKKRSSCREIFNEAKFLLRKWNSSDPSIFLQIS